MITPDFHCSKNPVIISACPAFKRRSKVLLNAMVCREPSFAITAHPGEGPIAPVLLALWVFGYCVWGSSSGMAGLITPKPKVKKNVFIARFQVELLDRCTAWLDHEHCRSLFEAFRTRYNLHRPHEALDLAVPATRYQPSSRPWPKAIHLPQYLQGDERRLVSPKGEIKFKSKLYYVGQAFGGFELALRPTQRDGYFELFFAWKKIGVLDLNDPLIAQQYRPPLCSLTYPD